MPPKLPPHVRQLVNKTGRDYYYLQRYRGTDKAEKPVRLPHISDPTFWSEYARHMQLPAPVVRTDTFAALVIAWQASPQWGELRKGTKTNYTAACKRVIDRWGDLEVRGVEPKHVLMLQDEFADKVGIANMTITALSSMLSWSVPRGWRNDNPCREIKPLKGGPGYAPWPWTAIDEASRMPRQDLWWACALALYTGQRKGDAFTMSWTKIRDGLIEVTQESLCSPTILFRF